MVSDFLAYLARKSYLIQLGPLRGACAYAADPLRVRDDLVEYQAVVGDVTT
jgi:hypothetical protein